jgi:tRNA G18 (ribose-2'-O)-methylase SpoU
MLERFERARRRNLVSAHPGVHDCVLVLDGLKPDFNIAKIFRSADNFGAKAVHLINVPYFDPGPAKGSMRWVPFVEHNDFSSCHSRLSAQGYECFALDPQADETITSCSLPRRAAFVLGHEEFGFSFPLEQYSDIRGLSIPGWGRVQSLNVCVAASIILYEYTRQHGREQPAADNNGKILAGG